MSKENYIKQDNSDQLVHGHKPKNEAADRKYRTSKPA